MTARFGPMRSWIMALWRRSTHVRSAPTLKRKPTMITIFTTVEQELYPEVAGVHGYLARCQSAVVPRWLGPAESASAASGEGAPAGSPSRARTSLSFFQPGT